MTGVLSAHLYRIIKKHALNSSHLKIRTYLSAVNREKIVKSFPLCRNYCTSNSDKDNEDSDSICRYENLEEIAKKNPELTKKIESLKLEIENLHHDGNLIPKNIKTEYWKQLLEFRSPWKKRKLLTFLAKNEFKKESFKEKKAKKMAIYSERKELINMPNHLNYSIGQNALFMRINHSSIVNLLDIKCQTAMLYSNNIVFDVDYEKYMSPREIKETVKQLFLSACMNRDHINPLSLHFCNVPNEGKMKDDLEKFFNSYKAFNTVQVYEESYLDIFDRKSLVYLTPDARTELLEYNPDDVYIIGAYVDKGEKLPVSLGKAKANKLRTAKFPLDLYLKWKHGSKNLPLNQVLGIMLDLNYYRDMKKALSKHVPTRFYVRDEKPTNFSPLPDFKKFIEN